MSRSRDLVPAGGVNRRQPPWRGLLGVVDQGVLSVGSVLLLAVAAHPLGVAGLGQFAFGAATVLFVTSVARAIAGEPFVANAVPFLPRREGAMVSAVVLMAGTCGAVLYSSSFVPTWDGHILAGVAIAGPAALIQDAVRYLLIGRRREGQLLVYDVSAVALQTLAVGVTASTTRSAALALLAWGSALILVTAPVLIWSGVVLSPPNGLLWIRETWRVSSAYAAEAVVGAVVGYAALVVIRATAGSPAVAGYRTAIAVFGIVSVAINFVRSFYLRDLAASPLEGRQALAVVSRRLAFWLSLVVLAASIVIALVPDSVGRMVFGDAWALTVPLIWVASLNRWAASLSVVPTVLLRALGVGWQAARVRVAVGAASLGIAPVGAYFWGAAGALVGDALTYLLLAVLLLLLALRRENGRETRGE